MKTGDEKKILSSDKKINELFQSANLNDSTPLRGF